MGVASIDHWVMVVGDVERTLEFYRRLPNPDRQFIILAGASHAVALGHTRQQLWHVMRAFLEMPRPS